MDVFSAMDVTVYPPPPQPLAAPDHTRLGQLSYPDPAFGTNKVSKERRSLHGLLCFSVPGDERHVCDVLSRSPVPSPLSVFSSLLPCQLRAN